MSAQDRSSKGYRKLIVWMRMQELVILVYSLTKKFPDAERFGLTSQMQRAAVSVLSNFVEGYLKRSTKEKLLYLERSQTSLMELEAQGEVVLLLKYIDEVMYEKFDNKRAEVGYLLHQYASKIV